MIRILVVLFCATILAACTSVRVDKEERLVRGFDDTPFMVSKVAKDNFSRASASYQDEWRFNRNNPNRPPQLCLAMSGGGMRSAAFNIGVLKGLHQAGLLDRVDVMSSVSGGGYALSWYYLQQINTHADEKELFDNNGRFQRYLENNSNLAYDDPDSLVSRSLSYVVAAGKWLVAWPAHFVANGVFDWHANLNPLRLTYENGIEHVFHLSPASATPENDGFTNAAIFMAPSAVESGKEVTFPQAREYISTKHLPYFVINATVLISDDPNHYGAEFSKTIYEFTPLWHGSDVFGKRFTEFPFKMSRAVAVSGAAKDSSTTPGAVRQVLDAMTNTDLGYFISNPHPDVSQSMRVWSSTLPFPAYAFLQNYNDMVGTDIYLTDGGHSDNLATFSLVRRMCNEIIVVDAEHDPKFKMEGYKRLKNRLSSEMKVEFDLPEFKPQQPVMTTTISGFPVQYPGDVRKSRDITIRYLKLSIDPEKLEQYNPAVQGYYAKHGTKGDRGNRFPQQSTADINYSRNQFRAYRELGADMVRIYLEPQMQAKGTQKAALAQP